MHSVALDNQTVPVPSTTLIGRTRELDQIREALAEPGVRLLTLIGPGGVGKTRLAVQAANEIRTTTSRTVHIVSLATASDEAAVLSAVARELGIYHEAATPSETAVQQRVEQRIEQRTERRIEAAIGERAVFLVLDNAEGVVDHLLFVPRLLKACPNVQILVTSQIMLRLSAEHVVPVHPLSTSVEAAEDIPPATALFIERARAVRPDLRLEPEDLRVIDTICQQLDGLPLAIELAAARTRFLTPVALHARLIEALPVLVDGPRDAPERHRTLRATLAWSYSLLDSDERALFRRLSVFENGGPLAAAMAMADTVVGDRERSEALLSNLIDHSLVRITERPGRGPRVHLLQTVKEYARELLATSGDEVIAREAHARWFADLVRNTPTQNWRTGTPELRVGILRFEPDLANFRSALEWMMESHNEVTAVEMTSGLVVFWMELGHAQEGRRWTLRVLPFADQADVNAQITLNRMMALTAANDDATDEAVLHARRSLELAEETGNARMIANCQNDLGILLFQTGDAEAGERMQLEAIRTIQSEAADPLGGALFAATLANELINRGEFDRAEPLLRDAMPLIARYRADALPLFHGTVAYIAISRGQLDEAGERLEQSLEYHRDPPHRLPLTLAERLFQSSDLGSKRAVPAIAARLLGAADLLIAQGGATRLKICSSQVDPDRVEAELRAMLGDGEFSRETAIGARLTVPAMIALALDVARMRGATGAPDREAGSPFDLTPRERDVLALLVTGKSNAAIAEELFISQRTVTTHLSRLYAKLGVTTRAEAIALENRQHLISSRDT